jgi:tetratricopeptide (TPR) repeat protein
VNKRTRFRPAIGAIVTAPARGSARLFTLVMEGILTPRGLAVLFAGIAAALAIAGWLRPTLTKDISGLHISMGVWRADNMQPEQLLYGPRHVALDSPGVFLLGLTALGLLWALLQPRRLGMAAGLLLCGTIAANAAIAVNHPALIELLDREYEQRQQIVGVLGMTAENIMTGKSNCRTRSAAAPVGDQQRGDLSRGWNYLLYGEWLAVWACVGVLLGVPGSLRRRLLALSLWGSAGAGLALVFCAPRVHAEYHWLQAKRLEAEGHPEAARQSLQRAFTIVPEFEQLERTWLLQGKLDFAAGTATPYERFYRAFQLARDKAAPRSVTVCQDVPWAITDARQQPLRLIALDPVPSAPIPDPLADKAATPNGDERLDSHEDRFVQEYKAARDRDCRRAIALMAELRADGASAPAVRAQAARLWSDLALNEYHQKTSLTTTFDAWQRAAALDPQRRDCAFYVGTLQARFDRERPERVRSELQPILADIGDQVLNAEILNTLGNACFEAGWVTEARRLYAESYDLFCLPKSINFRAQRKLGGL